MSNAYTLRQSVRNSRPEHALNLHSNLATRARAVAPNNNGMRVRVRSFACRSVQFPNFVFTCNRTINMLSWRVCVCVCVLLRTTR